MTHVRSRVRFPRFESESNLHKPAFERELQQRAQPRRWLSKDAVEVHQAALQTPSPIIPRSLDMREKNGWQGLSHTARVRPSVSVRLPLAFVVSHRESLVWLDYYRHDYHWDTQSVPGRKTELVLKTYGATAVQTPGAISYKSNELAALLIDDDNPDIQRLVINDGEGWRQPEPVDELKAKTLVSAMTKISTRELVVYDRDKQLMAAGLNPDNPL